jgi:DNA-binding HxlR family transcriptional regulator
MEVRTFMWHTHKEVTMAGRDKVSTEVRDRLVCADRLTAALRSIDGRWKMPLLAHLSAKGIMRFSDLERSIPQASQKMLTQHLRELERDGIVTRTVYPEVPPRVEYGLTDVGKGLGPVFRALADWADQQEPQTKAPRTQELPQAC